MVKDRKTKAILYYFKGASANLPLRPRKRKVAWPWPGVVNLGEPLCLLFPTPSYSAMAVKGKGKQVAAESPGPGAGAGGASGSGGKRRMASSDAGAGPSSSSAAKRRRRAGVLQFVDDVAGVDDDYEEDELESEDDTDDGEYGLGSFPEACVRVDGSSGSIWGLCSTQCGLCGGLCSAQFGISLSLLYLLFCHLGFEE